MSIYAHVWKEYMMQQHGAYVESSFLLSFTYVISGQPGQVVRFEGKEPLPKFFIYVSYVDTDL